MGKIDDPYHGTARCDVCMKRGNSDKQNPLYSCGDFVCDYDVHLNSGSCPRCRKPLHRKPMQDGDTLIFTKNTHNCKVVT